MNDADHPPTSVPEVVWQTTIADRSQAHAEDVKDRTPFSRFIALMRPDRHDLMAIGVFSTVIGILGLATPVAVEALVNNVAFTGSVQPVIVLVIILFGCLAIANCMSGLQTYLMELIQRRLFVRTLADLAGRLPRVRREVFDLRYGPELVNRYFDVVTLQKVTSVLVLDGAIIVLSTVIGMVVLAFYHPLLLVFDLLLLGSLAVIIFVVGRNAVTTSLHESKAKYAVVDWLEELTRHLWTFHLQAGRELAVTRTKELATDYLKARSAHFRVLFRQSIFLLVLQVLTSTALLGLGGWLVIIGQLTLGQLVAAELIVGTIMGSFAKLGKYFEGYYDLMAAVDKLGYLFDLPMETSHGKLRSDLQQGMTVRVEGVTFGCRGQGPLLENLDCEVAAGELLALLGPSASGKTAFAELLLGLRKPTVGRIELDGIDLRDWDLEALRGQVFAIQCPEIFAGSIADNIGLAGIDSADVHRALADLDLLKELHSLPNGVHTLLNVGGAPLSANQLQRLMLARAMVARPRLLLIDESLDTLDESTRDRVFAQLRDRTSSTTIIIFTSLASVARQCSRSVALRNGQVTVMTE